MIRILTTTVDQTRAVARALAELARPGDLILLAGELGAGKTAFTQGFAAGLGVPDRVTSPTFTLARAYQGRLVLNHLDVYRLEHIDEAVDLGLGELLDDGGVTLVEWGDTILPVLPADLLEVRLTFGDGPDDRVVDLRLVGPRWSSRQKALQSAMAQVCGHAAAEG